RAMALRIPSVGRVTVSLRRSIMAVDYNKTKSRVPGILANFLLAGGGRIKLSGWTICALKSLECP
ncbi:MAG: hypothetical protein ACT4O4_09015, partial [Nitrospiraceae bacterium]